MRINWIGLWKALVLRDYFEVRIPYEKGDMLEPKNWRKVYLVRTPVVPRAAAATDSSIAASIVDHGLPP